MFFMKVCVMSASLIDDNPFDQPGVEAYKQKMIELLKQPQLVANVVKKEIKCHLGDGSSLNGIFMCAL